MRAAGAVAVEIGWVATHLVTYPLGLLRDRGDDVDPRIYTTDRMSIAERSLLATDPAAASTPIVLIHGVVDNRTIFTMLRRGLRRRGFASIRTFSYGPQTHDMRSAAEALGTYVERVCEETAADQVHIVGHSLGGLIARYYVQTGGSPRVHTVITLGTPHLGTRTAKLVPHPLIRQMRPESETIAELAAPAPDCDTRFIAFYSDVDQMIIPADHARVEHPDLRAVNIRVAGLGHLSLPISRRIVHQICTTLAGQVGPDEVVVTPEPGIPGYQPGAKLG
jgi:pimeloyl-ACP methyl ester carboxylesterase